MFCSSPASGAMVFPGESVTKREGINRRELLGRRYFGRAWCFHNCFKTRQTSITIPRDFNEILCHPYQSIEVHPRQRGIHFRKLSDERSRLAATASSTPPQRIAVETTSTCAVLRVNDEPPGSRSGCCKNRTIVAVIIHQSLQRPCVPKSDEARQPKLQSGRSHRMIH